MKDIRYSAILHQKLRSFDHCLKLLYHLVSGQTHTWSETGLGVKRALTNAKQEVIDHIWKHCNFLVDTPTSNGGNTNIGPTSELFFKEANRVAICSVIRKESDRVAFSKLLGLFNIMLSITQRCDYSKLVIPEKVQSLGTKLMLFHKSSFPFAFLSPTVHQMCGHSHELFEMTDGKPIAVYSEQSGEAWNKHIKAFKSGPAARARQTSLALNIRDITSRMMISTHPDVVAKRIMNYCKLCACYDHTLRGCPKRRAMVLTEEQAEISCYYATC